MLLAAFRDVPMANIEQLFRKNKFLFNLFTIFLKSLNFDFRNGLTQK